MSINLVCMCTQTMLKLYMDALFCAYNMQTCLTNEKLETKLMTIDVNNILIPME